MHFLKTTACISSILMATVSTSTPTSFEIPGFAPGTTVASDVDTTTVYDTSTYYVTSAATVTSAPVASVPASRNNTLAVSSSCSDSAPPAAITPSLYVTGNQTLIPVTLWEGSTTRVIFPQNGTALEIPTSHYANSSSTVVVSITAPSSKTAATTSEDKASSTASTSASASEVPVNGAGKIASNAVLGIGAVAGLMALL